MCIRKWVGQISYVWRCCIQKHPSFMCNASFHGFNLTRRSFYGSCVRSRAISSSSHCRRSHCHCTCHIRIACTGSTMLLPCVSGGIVTLSHLFVLFLRQDFVISNPML